MGKNEKLQLKAMNVAIEDFAKSEIKRLNLTTAQGNSVKQMVLYNEPYNNIKVYKSGELYDTLLQLSNDVVKTIKEVREKDRESEKQKN